MDQQAAGTRREGLQWRQQPFVAWQADDTEARIKIVSWNRIGFPIAPRSESLPRTRASTRSCVRSLLARISKRARIIDTDAKVRKVFAPICGDHVIAFIFCCLKKKGENSIRFLIFHAPAVMSG